MTSRNTSRVSKNKTKFALLGFRECNLLSCVSRLEPDLAKLTKLGSVSPFLLQVSPIQAETIRVRTFFNAVAVYTVNTAGRNVKTVKLHARVACVLRSAPSAYVRKCRFLLR